MKNFTKTAFVCLLIVGSASVNSSTVYSNRLDSFSVPCVTNEGHIAAISEEYLDMAIGFVVDKDNVALKKLLDLGVIVILKKGIKVYLVDTHIFAGTVEFRVQGVQIFFGRLQKA